MIRIECYKNSGIKKSVIPYLSTCPIDSITPPCAISQKNDTNIRKNLFFCYFNTLLFVCDQKTFALDYLVALIPLLRTSNGNRINSSHTSHAPNTMQRNKKFLSKSKAQSKGSEKKMFYRRKVDWEEVRSKEMWRLKWRKSE
jgi:hypothetical protein